VTFFAEYAWVDGDVARDVLIEVAGGRFTAVTPGAPAGAATRLPGLVLPGFANAHSHAFHRALRGRTQAGRGSFWTWRERMYEVAGRLDPESYHELARAVYGEMALAGITCVGEFHYLHHGPDGTPYADPNAMGEALLEGAREAGIRITLLDTLYLTSSMDGDALEGVQRRFGDGDLEHWAARVDRLRPGPWARAGAAIHSVRAVPERYLGGMTGHGPLHVHLSEQPAENERCQARYGCSPTELLRRNGVLGLDTTVVHATHLGDDDVKALSGSGVCFCPTTERDLADGIGPARALADAGARLSLGSDSQAVIDPFEEARALEMDERLATGRRGHFTAAELLSAGANHAALGWDDAGRIAAGYRADLVAVSLDGVRTAGVQPDGVVYAATASDVTHLVVDGRHVVSQGRHIGFDVPAALRRALT
jgi:formiminoglutamate deiminase